MSEQIKQITSIQIRSLIILEQAVAQIEVESLGTFLKLDRSKKEARYYNGYMDRGCVAVITYGRPLTQAEQQTHYEIAVKQAVEKINGEDVTVYNLFADTFDKGMGDRVATVFEEYILKSLSETAMENGAFEAEEVLEAGGYEIPAGYRCMKFSYQD
jgi:hypothetical protein